MKSFWAKLLKKMSGLRVSGFDEKPKNRQERRHNGHKGKNQFNQSQGRHFQDVIPRQPHRRQRYF